MWFTFYKEKEFYFIKTTIEDNEFRCLLTNLKYIWLEILPLEDVYSRFKVLNPAFTVPTEESLKQICELVESIQQAEIETKQESDILNIKIKGSEYEFPVKYEFCCKKVDSDLEITSPLLSYINNQQEQLRNLSSLLEKKDREIEEYKLKTGETVRRSLVTEKFNMEEFNESMKSNPLIGAFSQLSGFWPKFNKDEGYNTLIKEEFPSEPPKKKIKVRSTTTSKRKQLNSADFKEVKTEPKG